MLTIRCSDSKLGDVCLFVPIYMDTHACWEKKYFFLIIICETTPGQHSGRVFRLLALALVSGDYLFNERKKEKKKFHSRGSKAPFFFFLTRFVFPSLGDDEAAEMKARPSVRARSDANPVVCPFFLSREAPRRRPWAPLCLPNLFTYMTVLLVYMLE